MYFFSQISNSSSGVSSGDGCGFSGGSSSSGTVSPPDSGMWCTKIMSYQDIRFSEFHYYANDHLNDLLTSQI